MCYKTPWKQFGLFLRNDFLNCLLFLPEGNGSMCRLWRQGLTTSAQVLICKNCNLFKTSCCLLCLPPNKLIRTWHQLPVYGNQNLWAFLRPPFFPFPLPSPLPVHWLTWNNTAWTSKNGEIAGWSSKLVFSWLDFQGWTGMMYTSVVPSLSTKFIKNSHQSLPVQPIFGDKSWHAVWNSQVSWNSHNLRKNNYFTLK